jgi:hypothetical protein
MSDEIMRRAASLSDAAAGPGADGSVFLSDAAVIRRSSLGSGQSGQVIQSSSQNRLGGSPRPPFGANAGPLDMDELVDAVVERIEQRVVDELERRGRRHTPGAF